MLRKALAHALATQTEYAFCPKYHGKTRPTFADVPETVGGSKEIGKYLEKVTGQRPTGRSARRCSSTSSTADTSTTCQPCLTPAGVFAATSTAEMTLPLIRDAGLTWENVVSHLGSSKEVWMCIPIMGEMAITRNLRNFEEAGISPSAWDQIYERMAAVEDTVQLPFRFFSAEREVSSTAAKSLLGRLLDRAVEKVADLSGTTMVLSDNGEAPVGLRSSGKSKLRVSDCGNMLEAVLAKRLGRRAIIGVFGDSMMWVPFSQADSCLAIKNRIDAVAHTEERSKNGAMAIPQFEAGRVSAAERKRVCGSP